MKSEFYEQKTVLGALLRSEPVNYRTKHKICDPGGCSYGSTMIIQFLLSVQPTLHKLSTKKKAR